MARWMFSPSGLDPQRFYRIDTASGSDSPATIYRPGSDAPISEATLKTGPDGRLPRFEAATASLYAKPLNYLGQPGDPVAVTGSWDRKAAEELLGWGSIPVYPLDKFGIGLASTPSETWDAIMTGITAAAPSAGGFAILDVGKRILTVDKTVALLPGVVLRGLNLRGRPNGATVIKAANGSNLDAVVASQQWVDNDVTHYSGYSAGLHGVCIDGNKANQTGGLGYGVVMATYRAFIRDVSVVNSYGSGIALSSVMRNGTSQYPVNVNMAECHIESCFVETPGGHGIVVNEGSLGGKITDGFLVNNIVRGGVNANNDGIYMKQSGGWNIYGNHTYSTGRGGLRVNGGPVAIIGNYIENFARTTGLGTVYGIDAQLYSGGSRIVGNDVWCQGDQVGSGTVPVGIRVAAGSNTANAVAACSGNTLRHTTTTVAGSIGLKVEVPSGGSASLSLAMPQGANVYVGWERETVDVRYAQATRQSAVPGSYVSGFAGSKPAAGKFITPACTGTSTVNMTTLNSAYYMAIDIPWDTQIDAMGISLTVAPSATNCHMYLALYSDNGSGYAPALGVSPICSGEVDLSGTGDRLVTVAATLQTGRYWGELRWLGDAQATAPTVVSCTSIRSTFDNLGNNSHRGLNKSAMSGVPGQLSGSFGLSGYSPFIGLRVAA